MAFLDKLSGIAKQAGAKAGDAVEISKLSAKQLSEKSAAADAIKKIGEYYFEQLKDATDIDEKVAEFVASAKEHFAAVEALQAEIDKHKESIKAPMEEAAPAGAAAEEAPAAEAPAEEVVIEDATEE